jgi:uncharacterized protein YciI
MRAQAGWGDHATFMDNLTASGFILMGGPLTDSSEILLIISAGDEQQARAVLRDDPWESAGILFTRQIRPWIVLLDSREYEFPRAD